MLFDWFLYKAGGLKRIRIRNTGSYLLSDPGGKAAPPLDAGDRALTLTDHVLLVSEIIE